MKVIVYTQPTHGPWSADAPAKIDTLALHLGLEVEFGGFWLGLPIPGLMAWVLDHILHHKV